MKKWVSVNEKTPDPKQYDWVLVSYILEPEGSRGCPSVAEYRDGKWFDWGGDMEEIPGLRVTHWMPLPLDPDEKRGFKYYIRRALAWLTFILAGRGEIADEGVDAGILDYSGEGRDSYGR